MPATTRVGVRPDCMRWLPHRILVDRTSIFTSKSLPSGLGICTRATVPGLSRRNAASKLSDACHSEYSTTTISKGSDSLRRNGLMMALASVRLRLTQGARAASTCPAVSSDVLFVTGRLAVISRLRTLALNAMTPSASSACDITRFITTLPRHALLLGGATGSNP